MSAVGATVTPDGVDYRVWAPDHERVGVRIENKDAEIALVPEGKGFFAGRDPRGKAGDRYRFQLAGALLPDPASRFQPQGVEGPSEVVDARQFEWKTSWVRPSLRGRVIYELHVGAFTREGTFAAAIERLDDLVDLGVNTIELMPVGDFSGRWNWGYDGVMLFAPARCYGIPDTLRALVDAAHARGIAVILDVVYNHLGPCGNVLARYSRGYFHASRSTLWGQGLNFDGPDAGPVRAFFLQNAAMWFDEFRVDGLRLDAVHAIVDDSEPHIVSEIAALAEARGGFTIAEDERNEARIISRADEKGWGVHGMWSDDFHHSVRVALTGQRHAYYANYHGFPDELVEILHQGWLFSGQVYPGWGRNRGSPAQHIPPERFVFCISNHDQVGNRPLGDRLHATISPPAYRAASMLCCLVPQTPLLFMGQEWAATSPFPFFTDHPGDLGAEMATNRIREFEHSNAFYGADVLAKMPDPQAETTFQVAKLDWRERGQPAHAATLALYRDCLRLRAREEIFQSPPRLTWRVQKVSAGAIALRWSSPAGDWLLVVVLSGAAPGMGEDPITRPTTGRTWTVVLTSNDPRYVIEEPDTPKLPSGGEVPVAVLWRESAVE